MATGRNTTESEHLASVMILRSLLRLILWKNMPGVHVHNPRVPVKETKTKNSKQAVSNWKHLWKYLGRQVIWRRRQNALLQFTKKTTKSHWNRIFYQKSSNRPGKSIDRSLRPTKRMPWIIFRLWEFFQIFIFIRDAGRIGNKITGQLKTISHIARKTNLSSLDTVRAASNSWNFAHTRQ